jgi:hypothetical protein
MGRRQLGCMVVYANVLFQGRANYRIHHAVLCGGHFSRAPHGPCGGSSTSANRPPPFLFGIRPRA